MGGGGGGVVSQVAAMGPTEKGPSLANVQYSPPPQGARYKASYQPMQARQPAQQFQIPSLDQMGQFEQQLDQFQQPSNLAGLQDVFAQMMSGNLNMQQPVQRGLVNPNYQSQALNYRPNLTGAMENLNRVVPSVAEMDRRAAEEAAREKARKDAWDAAHPQPIPDHYWGGA